jgi:hypothetical protein
LDGDRTITEVVLKFARRDVFQVHVHFTGDESFDLSLRIGVACAAMELFIRECISYWYM